LREIERKTYDARQFLEELKQMVSEVVMSVLSDNSNRRITIQEAVSVQQEEKGKKETKKRERKPATPKKKAAPTKPAAEPVAGNATPSSAAPSSSTPAGIPAPPKVQATHTPDPLVGQTCPLCGKGTIIKGKAAYGCSEWRSGCTYRKTFE
ncbi:MAG TPA: DNA topoisomerase III, partial [Bacteroides reticulotermitis]|nr:DNA topoisomerase III [Bacteroides reticulotermitis]